jgi:UDP-N-acetylglucosamine--dolichyl-phosphate N-acetylglucosaminephosphotransferase
MILPFLLIFSVGFLVTFLLMPSWITKAKQLGLIWDDMNKIKSDKVAGSGGLIVVLGFLISVLAYIAFRVFYLKSTDNLIEIFALISSILIISFIGFIDDFMGWKRGGLSIKSRLILVLLSSIPLVVINVGREIISIPFIGQINLGLIYPLILIPLAILGTTTTFNFLAGFNGLEAGQGTILLSSLALVAYNTNSPWLSVILMSMVFPLLAFLIFNFYPAKVFPGDVLTYSVGSLIAISAILGNFEKVAIFFFIPYILEVILKSRGKLKKYSFGKPNSNDSLDLLYPRLYGLTHVSILILKKMNIKPTEKKVVYLIWAFQILVILIGFIIFRNGIFIK